MSNRKGSLTALNSQAVASLTTSVLTLWVISTEFGTIGVGTFAIFSLIQNFLPHVCSIGVPIAITHFVGSNQISCSEALRLGLKHWCITTPATVAGLLCALPLLSDTIFPNIPTASIYAAIVSHAFTSWIAYSASILHGLGNFTWSSRIQIIRSAICLTATCLSLLFHWDINQLMWALATCQGAIALTFLAIVYPTLHNKFHHQSSITLKRALSFGWKAQATIIANQINYRADVYLINLFINPSATGVYLIASQIADAIATGASSLATIIFTRISQSPNQYQLTIRYTIFGVLITVASSLTVVPTATCLIPKLFGSNFSSISDPLQWLAAGIIANSASRILANDIAGRGHPLHNFWSASFASVINIILNVVLIPTYGITGAAIATASSFAADSTLKVVIFCHLIRATQKSVSTSI